MITGKDLIEMGYKPSKWFGEAIEKANKDNLSGDSLRAFIESIQPEPFIEPHGSPVRYHKNIKAEHPEEVKNVSQVFDTMDELMKTPTLVGGAVMPDACPTGEIGQIPVGGIAVARNAIHPAMHSADICCSVMMSSFGNKDPKKVLDEAIQRTHFGGGGRPEHNSIPKDLMDSIKGNPFLKSQGSVRLATEHMGTQGDGNHFLFIGMLESTGETVMVTHHGSRGFGANLYKQGMKLAEKFRKEISPKTLKRNAWIPYTEQEGKDYWEALQIVREWTKLNHSTIHDSILHGVGKELGLRFWNEHNFVFKDGEDFYHAKGATPLDDKFVPDSHYGLRLIPLNMSQPILVVRGETTETNLGFSPHGAGRNISRAAHNRKHSHREMEHVFEEETKGLDVRFYSGNIDLSELPSAYKDANNVQAQIKEFGLGNVVDRILPYGCIMAGDWKINAPWRNKNKS